MPLKAPLEHWPGVGTRIAEELRERRRRGEPPATQIELGRRAGVSRQTVSRVLSDDRITRPVAERIARALQTTAEWLREGGGPPPRVIKVAGGEVILEGGQTGLEAAIQSPPGAARAFVHDFLAEAARAGANEEDELVIQRALRNPELALTYRGGQLRDATEEELLEEMKALAEGLRVWLRERIARRGEQVTSG